MLLQQETASRHSGPYPASRILKCSVRTEKALSGVRVGAISSSLKSKSPVISDGTSTSVFGPLRVFVCGESRVIHCMLVTTEDLVGHQNPDLLLDFYPFTPILL